MQLPWRLRTQPPFLAASALGAPVTVLARRGALATQSKVPTAQAVRPGPLAVEISSAIALVMQLRVKGEAKPMPEVMACQAFPRGTRDFAPATPWQGAGEPPVSKALAPVLALRR